MQIQESEAVFAVDYRGISVPQAAALRTRLREADATFRVTKNTLTERAADNADAPALKDFLQGPTAMTFVRGDAAAAAKALRDFHRANQLLEFKGGWMNGAALSADEIQSIAQLPSRDVLYGRLVGMVASPLTGLASAMNGLIGGLAPAMHTTPDAPTLHELLKQFKAAGAQAVAMEVSSHGLQQERVGGIKFDIALFTNLTRDHLDYHETMAAYGQAKAKLFAWPGLRTAVVNADDPFGQSLIDGVRARGARVLTYGLAAADIAATELRTSGNGIEMSVSTPWGKASFASPMIGTAS